MDKRELLKFLAKHKQNLIVRQLAQELPDQPIFTVTGPIPIKNAQSIYRVRSTINEDRGGPIKGFSELVQGLYNFSGESIYIYSIDSEIVSYKIFADAAQEEFAGILKSPQAILEQAVTAQSELQAVGNN